MVLMVLVKNSILMLLQAKFKPDVKLIVSDISNSNSTVNCY